MKINQSLIYNDELTIKLLKEMDLFKRVPLSGDFKDLLVNKKYLLEYLENNSDDNIGKENTNSFANIMNKKERMLKLSELNAKTNSKENTETTTEEEIVEDTESSSLNMPVPSSPLYPKTYTGDSAKPLQGQYHTSESVDNNISTGNTGIQSFYG